MKRVFFFLLVFLLVTAAANASQDRNYGLGGMTSGRVGGVTAETDHPFSALYNPATLAAQSAAQFGVSTAAASASFERLGDVVTDSPTYRTESGVSRRGTYDIPATNLTLWAAGLAYPFRLPSWVGRRAGLGVVISGPFSRLRALNAATPYDFQPIRYGTADAQFKGTVSGGVELWPDKIYFGAGLSLFITGAGNAEATIAASNPTGRMALDVGWNSALIGGLYGNFGDTKASLVYRQAISPSFSYAFNGTVQIGTEQALAQPALLAATLYFEPQGIEAEVQHSFAAVKVSAGLLFQKWDSFQPAYLVASTRTAAGATVTTSTPAVAFHNTVSPRASFELPIFVPQLHLGFGYQFRPTPVGDLSGAGNLLDTDAHVGGACLEYRFPGWTLGAFGQKHWLRTRSVDKSASDVIGAPRYDFAGSAYAVGMSLQAAL